MRRIYSNDASIYEELPAAVAFPNTEIDVQTLIRFAEKNRIGLIPRAAGTSLAGQVVGSGIVVDVSRYMNQIVEINPDDSWVRVQPGVVRDDLNFGLAKHEMFFAPETSTSNRATIGGMLGNNSCGANSIVFGSTRDHVIEVSGFLSDGSHASFGAVSNEQFDEICDQDSRKRVNEIYRQLRHELSSDEVPNAIRSEFPKPTIHRRNTGYAVDALLDAKPFGGKQDLNLAKLIAGSEGTLFFATEIKLNCEPLKQNCNALICVHFQSVEKSIAAVQAVMKHRPAKCELIDKHVIEGARRNSGQSKNLTFLVGQPEAVLLVEFAESEEASLDKKIESVVCDLEESGFGYAYPVVRGLELQQAWQLRKAGLGVVSNTLNAKKPVTVIEDTAVDLRDLPDFVADIDQLLTEEYGLSCVQYGHVGAGELHFRPTLDLGVSGDVEVLRSLSQDVAKIVKRYRGSLSGEHGDGRLRSEHLELMVGQTCYELLCRIKKTWDPNGIFNLGKITNAVRLDSDLKPKSDAQLSIHGETIFRFGENGLAGAAAMCSGSGDCRKSQLHGGTMCPSFMATRNEYDSTRARANLLRQILEGSNDFASIDEVDLELAKDILDLCLSCKGCKNECPSSVDMAKIKSEFTFLYFKRNKRPIQQRWLADFAKWTSRSSFAAPIFNRILENRRTSGLFKRLIGIHNQRSIPKIASQSLGTWFTKRPSQKRNRRTIKKIFLFCDEFTNHIDVSVGKATIELLEMLGYEVAIPEHVESGRSAISFGMLEKARAIADRNVRLLTKQVSNSQPLIGIEPSAFLTIRDEYIDLVSAELRESAIQLASNAFTVDEFLFAEIGADNISRDSFADRSDQKVLLHLHCHQKALSQPSCVQNVLEFAGFQVEQIPSGCCGMAGFFGFEKEKFDLSNQIGELVLFPAIRTSKESDIIVATGTSCRHQILDGTGRRSLHPIEILRDRVRKA